MDNLHRQLIAFGIHLLATRLGQVVRPDDPWAWQDDKTDRAIFLIRRARLLLGDDLDRNRPLRDLLSVFNTLDPPLVAASRLYADAVLKDRVWPPVPLVIAGNGGTPLAPAIDDGPTDRAMERAALWEAFADSVLADLSENMAFDTFHYAFARHAWFVPGALRDPTGRGYGRAISVFEQWKATAALAHCLAPDSPGDETLLLVGGDIPGIQDMLYTIGSKSAAKSLRGRSLYLQLLNDAVVRRLLDALKLPWVNVISSAGGNFKLLAPAGIEQQLETLHSDLNKILLDLHGGDLSVALAWHPIPAARVADRGWRDDPDSAASALKELAYKLELSKKAPFANVVTEHYHRLLDPVGRGGPSSAEPGSERKAFCEVCRADVDDLTRQDETETDLSTGRTTITTFCRQCHSFPELARDLARSDTMVITQNRLISSASKPAAGLSWSEALRSLGYGYAFANKGTDFTSPGANRWILYLNDTEFPWRSEPATVYGFRFQTQLTPWEPPATGASREIRDTHTMASDDATGLHRYGVLRMDVDSLGQAAATRLRFPDVLHVSALSAALSVFFEGQLDGLCRHAAGTWLEWLDENCPTKVEEEDQQTVRSVDADLKVPYVLYAGGDDLLMVAPWDVLPWLANSLRQALWDYTGGHLTMSGGIGMGTEKFPLYQSADMALDALDGAKDTEVRHREGGYLLAEKNALGLLGTTVSWEEWDGVFDTFTRTVRLLRRDGVSRALLSVLGFVAQSYDNTTKKGGADPSTGEVVIGPWVWALHYGLRRIAQRESVQKGSPELEVNIMKLADSALDLSRPVEAPKKWSTVRHLGLIVRWVEFLTRQERDNRREE